MRSSSGLIARPCAGQCHCAGLADPRAARNSDATRAAICRLAQAACQGAAVLLDSGGYTSAAGRNALIPFFVQIKCHLGKAYSVANALADAEIASEIYSTAGDFDLLVKFYVEHGTDIGHFVNEKVQTIPGILDTKTIITFKAF
jgi:DNA-binding Lrp family transcriptional regulator